MGEVRKAILFTLSAGIAPCVLTCARRKPVETKFCATTYGSGLSVHPVGYRVGKVRVGKKAHKIAVLDGNLDGRYDKIFSLPVKDFYPAGCEIFAIDRNSDGRRGPASVCSSVRHSSSRVLIDFDLVGKAGEHYDSVVMRNNKRVPAPRVTIIDEVGGVLASGRFEYG
jgi:hypothetical protein